MFKSNEAGINLRLHNIIISLKSLENSRTFAFYASAIIVIFLKCRIIVTGEVNASALVCPCVRKTLRTLENSLKCIKTRKCKDIHILSCKFVYSYSLDIMCTRICQITWINFVWCLVVKCEYMLFIKQMNCSWIKINQYNSNQYNSLNGRWSN